MAYNLSFMCIGSLMRWHAMRSGTWWLYFGFGFHAASLWFTLFRALLVLMPYYCRYACHACLGDDITCWCASVSYVVSFVIMDIVKDTCMVILWYEFWFFRFGPSLWSCLAWSSLHKWLWGFGAKWNVCKLLPHRRGATNLKYGQHQAPPNPANHDPWAQKIL